jgi:hypothetical protein
MSESHFSAERKAFHTALLGSILTINENGVVSNADGSQKASRRIARGIIEKLEAATTAERRPGQTSGNIFEGLCTDYLERTFCKLNHIRPGGWRIRQIKGRSRLEIATFEQYKHLVALHEATIGNQELAAALGNDYAISPDVVISRELYEDDAINQDEFLVDDSTTRLASLRVRNGGNELLHASISCKWTIRSDRAQNARSEALNLVRNRKGRLPHIVVVTAEPTPSRLASIALGTGDIDCVYHFALYELQQTLDELDYDDAKDMLNIMIEGKRIKDISDLPLDLAV